MERRQIRGIKWTTTKTFTNWLKWCTSQQNTKKMKKQNEIHESELFWVSHPNSYISMYMKYDWFQMDRIEFMAKYILELQTSKLEEMKEAIKSVLVPIWKSIDTSEKYMVLSILSGGNHYVDTFHVMLNFQEAAKCSFLQNAIERTFNEATGLVYSRNYFAYMGIKSSKQC